ncbi:MAG: ABC transporter permease [Gammaproteobacteria bacterium]|jgi:ABC-type polysaccharide/polyol phosphate export permease
MDKRHLHLALQDLRQGFMHWRIWLLLGWQDIRLRYRRSTLGPFWITLSMAAMIYSMGFLYGKLFKLDLSAYYPFVATGMVTWTFISTMINNFTESFSKAAGFIKQIKLPFSVYILRAMTADFIVFLHNFLAIIPILLFFDTGVTPLLLLVLIFNIILLLMCFFCYGYILALIGTRFQDIKPIVGSILQIVFLLTPILWMPQMLPDRFEYLADANPFYQLVNLIREPLTGSMPSLFTYGYISALIVGGFIVMILLLWRSRHRIAFWL